MIEKKKVELARMKAQLEKLTSEEEEDKKEFMEFALGFIHDTGKHFLQPYVSKEHRLVCKQMLFPGGIYINEEEKVYTPKVSVFFRGEVLKKDAEASDNSHLAQD